MNDGQYTNIRNYLEENSSLLKELIAEQKRTNELLNEIRLATNRTDGRLKDVTSEFVEGAEKPATKTTAKKSK